ncbi:DinB family protein [Streptomyces sp. NPDC002073]|uniref:DinB family protein n=1 Tax=Streptomyces sp. NBC_00239 TaxID=2903640 RepID=UPI002E292699|nr:DinB family protein [Streptomyces sp. NBC_00239]
MTPPRIRPPYTADERTQLTGWLEMQRAVVRWKCEGLSEADAHRAVLPGSPLMTAAGLLGHLRWVEHLWFEVVLLGGEAKGPGFEGPEDSEMHVQGIPLARLAEDYARQCARTDEIIAGRSLDETGRHPDFKDSAASLRWILFHMIEETARHAGHLDAIREFIDGETGYF